MFPSFVAKVLMAMIAGAFIAAPDDQVWSYAVFVAWFVLGSSVGWGRPIGVALGGQNSPEPEKWQVGPLEDDRLALVARGAFWLGPTALLTFVSGNWMWTVAAIAMTAAFVAAPYLSKSLFEMEDRWANMEYLRGALFALGLAIPKAVGL